jgi:hypothetical protein
MEQTLEGLIGSFLPQHDIHRALACRGSLAGKFVHNCQPLPHVRQSSTGWELSGLFPFAIYSFAATTPLPLD